MPLTTILTVSGIVIPSLITFCLGRFVSYREDRRRAAKERLDGFYNPFVALHAKTTKARAMDFSDFSPQERMAFVDLLIDRQVYAGESLTGPIQDLIQAYTGVYLAPASPPNQEEVRYVDQAFRTCVELCCKEWEHLRKKFY